VSRALRLLLLLALAACDRRPQAILMCHNSNCAHATDPAADDTLASLDDSLALTYLGRPPIAGVEIDTVWDSERSLCLFAHDFDKPADELAMEAVDRVTEHMLGAGAITWDGAAFRVKIESKAAVTPDGADHSPQDLAAHQACVLDMIDRLLEAAVAGDRELEILLEAEDIEFVRTLTHHARWPGKEPAEGLAIRLEANVKSSGLTPEDLVSLTGGDNPDGIDVLAFHSTRFPDGQEQAYEALDVDLMLWMLDASLETFYAAEVYHPAYVNTSEAELLRRWMED
jgi:hypothetical protein